MRRGLSMLGIGTIALLLMTACGGSETKADATGQVPMESTTVTAAQATADSRAQVLMIGTSLTAGLGLDPDDAYPAVLQALADSNALNVTFVNLGLSGETSAGALRRMDWVLNQPGEVVVIETGANDGLRGLDPDSTRANIVGIIQKVRAVKPDARVLLAQMEAPPNLGQRYTRDFHDLFLTISRDEGVTLIPFFLEGIAGMPNMNQSDGIHPNEEGARLAARNMWKTLLPVLRQVPGVVTR